jgi:RNA polymerase sigma-70 factor (ECF subfamily)
MEDAFLNMIDEHQNIIHKVCGIYRDTLQDREDLFQEIVLQLWKAFPGFRNESKASTWMYRIALNTAIAVFRKNKISLDFQGHIPVKLHPTAANELSENEERLFGALRKLSKAERAIISLYLEDYSYRQIAGITGITENYVGVRINRIKNKLKTILNN